MKIYGAEWCADCKRIMFYLDSKNIDYMYIDIDSDKDAKTFVMNVNPNGYASIPVLELSNQKILIEPTIQDIISELNLN